jgi:hypothetical protein
MVTRPLIEAARGRLSPCGVCAPAMEAMEKALRRAAEKRIENRMTCDMSPSLGLAEKRAIRARRIVECVMTEQAAFGATMGTGILRAAHGRRKRKICYM